MRIDLLAHNFDTAIGSLPRPHTGGKTHDDATQAARLNPNTGSGRSCVLRAFASSSPAMSRHEPQLEPQPVRMVNSVTVLQPLSAASRIWWSVIPLQMQTYTVGVGNGRPGIGLPVFQTKREWLSIKLLNHSRYARPISSPALRPACLFRPANRACAGACAGARGPPHGPASTPPCALCGIDVTSPPATLRASGARCRSARA